ncbi:TPR repeat-containing protein YrrB [mine drainage metagenome]|uniref:protein O-GlcNAc transferase n=1 Tax=mine drainage metagenome TaxID=410659 RepID=A0A1J5QPV4_9ZZZZ
MVTDVESPLARLASLAIEHHGAGRAVEAEACYRQALALDAEHGDTLHGLGILEWQAGRLEAAHRHLLDAVAANPDIWRYACTLGRFLAALGRNGEAVLAFARAKDLQPDSADVWLGYANALHATGRLGESISAYRQSSLLQPGNAEVFNNLGVALDAIGQRDDAIVAFQRGLKLRPDFVPLYNNLGNALLGKGLVDDAIAVFQRGLALDENSAKLWFNFANALATRGAGTDAIEAYRQAIAKDPGHDKALVNLGNTLRRRGELDAALLQYMRAIEQAPGFYDAYNNAGIVLLLMGRVDEAIAALERAMALEPDASVAHNNLGNAFKDAGRLDDAIACDRRAVELDPAHTEAHSNLVYTLCFHPGFDERAILAEAQRFASLHRPPGVRSAARRAGHDCTPGRRLRIGYVSPDFRNHCQSLFTLPLLSNHDHQAFEIHCYAELARPDEISARLAACADVWRPTQGMNDAQLAQLIADDGIDILVDLTMHMANGRPMLFAHRPAPVQVAWLAYPGTTGLPEMDYRFTDPWLDPPAPDDDRHGDDRYTEASVRLPDTFWCYDPLVSGLQPNALPALTAGYVTFGCLNNFCKVSDDTLRRWGAVMAGVPSSRLILLAAEGEHRQRVFDRLGSCGIAAERIGFVAYQPRAQYLQTYHRIDLCLDTLPYNGHTTSLDACWMGVPVVTQVGHTVVGRAGWSQLNNLGLAELAAFDDRAFVDIATRLATDLPRLGQLRQTLRARLEASPLMDGKRFASAIEAAYRQIWQNRCSMPAKGSD